MRFCNGAFWETVWSDGFRLKSNFGSVGTLWKLPWRTKKSVDYYNIEVEHFSGFFWPNVFFKALNDISLVIASAQKEDVESVLTKFYHTDIPNIDEYLRFADSNQKEGVRTNPSRTSPNRYFQHNYRIVFAEKIPDPTRLPTLGSDKYFLEFYNAIDPRQMLAIFASLLKERRILFTGRKVSTLSSCLHAVSMLLSPMCWWVIWSCITVVVEIRLNWSVCILCGLR